MKTLKVVDLDKLVEIHAQAFAGDTEMISEIEAIGHFDIMVSVFRVPFHQVAEDFDFGFSLSVEPLLVSY